MKKILTLAVLSAVTLNAPALAYSQRGYSEQCFKQVYREEYIPGTRNSPGRVRRWTENVEVPCRRPQPRPYREPRYNPAPQPQSNVDDNSCIEGAILGGLAGGAGGAALSRDEGMFIGIPLGIIGGVLIGCQLDGG
jgi:hypothetical protein